MHDNDYEMVNKIQNVHKKSSLIFIKGTIVREIKTT